MPFGPPVAPVYPWGQPAPGPGAPKRAESKGAALARGMLSPRTMTPRTMLATIALVVLASCGWPVEPDFTLENGLAVSVAGTSAEWAHAESYPAELEDVTSRALAFWGASRLDGWELVLTDARSVCDDAAGCTHPEARYIEVSVVGGYDVRNVIAHEIGHAIIGDADHEDPRWAIPVFPHSS